MISTLISLLLAIILPKRLPNIKNLRTAQNDELFPDGLPMGTVVMGKQGSGKTSWLARIIFWLFKKFPKRTFFILDPSGSLTDSILFLILQEPYQIRESLLGRIIYADLGNKDIVVPLPSFSPLYGTSYEEQAQLLARCFQRLEPHLVEKTPVLGALPLQETAPELFRLLCAIKDKLGDCWQVTEAKRLLVDLGLLRTAVNKFGGRVPEAKWYFEQDFLSRDLTRRERELRTHTLRAILGKVESREVRAMLGYPKPGFTPKEAIEKGSLVLICGEKLTNNEPAQHFLFTFIFLLIMATINQRRPGDPNDNPVMLVADEVYALLKIPGMAEEIGKLAPLYRSKKLEPVIVIQALWQLEEELQEKIWNMGNRVCFALENMDDDYKFAQQNFYYDSKNVKSPATSERQHPVYETDRGAYLEQANWIHGFKHREMVMRRYINEQRPDPYIRHVERTTENPNGAGVDQLESLKLWLLRKRGVSVTDALAVINTRNLVSTPKKPKSV